MEETRWVKHSSPGHSDLSCSGRLGGVVDVLTRSQQRLLFFSPLRSGGNLAQNTGSSVGGPSLVFTLPGWLVQWYGVGFRDVQGAGGPSCS